MRHLFLSDYRKQLQIPLDFNGLKLLVDAFIKCMKGF